MEEMEVMRLEMEREKEQMRLQVEQEKKEIRLQIERGKKELSEDDEEMAQKQDNSMLREGRKRKR